jgi:hypothetical protein
MANTPAMAVATWTVRPGGAVTATSAELVLRDATSTSQVECPSLAVKATLKGGAGLPGPGVGSVMSMTTGTCVGPLDFTFTLTFRHLPFTLNATSYDPGTGTTTAKITGIHGTFVGPSCSYVLDGTGAGMDDGTVVVTYANGSHMLKLLTTGGNLHAYNVQGGCSLAGGVSSNDRLTLSATGTVSPAQTITSP